MDYWLTVGRYDSSFTKLSTLKQMCLMSSDGQPPVGSLDVCKGSFSLPRHTCIEDKFDQCLFSKWFSR